MLTLAFTIYESGLCSECGQHTMICRDEANSFEVAEDTCQAKAAIDERMEATSKEKPDPGQIISAVLDDTPSVVKPPWET